MKRVVIFVNGELLPAPRLQSIIQPQTYIIAVDGGTQHALRMGVVPHIIIGDLDSLRQADRTWAEDRHIPIQPFSSRKDETDLELALYHAIRQEAAEIIVLGAFGGRLDHSVANLLLLSHPTFKDWNIRILEGDQTVFLIRDIATIPGKPGDLVSILPIGGDAIGVSNTGLEWPLDDETLPIGSPRGMSNVVLEECASIQIRQGLLLCIVTHQPC